MTEILDQAVEAMRQMTQSDRDSMAQAILTLARGSAPLDIEPEHLPIEPEHLPYVLEGLA